MKLSIFFALMVASCSSQNVASMDDKFIDVTTYSGYKVIEIEPDSDQDLRDFMEFCKGECDLWSSNEVMVTPGKWRELKMHWTKFKMTVIINDVQKFIDSQGEEARRKREIDDKINFEDYLTLDQIMSYLAELNSTHNSVLLETIGKTYEGRELQVLKICKNKQCGRNPAVWLDGGTHAREWITPAAATYAITQLIDTKEEALKRLDWYIMPNINPDGYAYSQKERRFWRKSRTSHCGKGCTCRGVDLNRNFPVQWNDTNGDSSSNACHQNYRGPKPLSDPESMAVKEFITRHKKSIKLFISLHSYGQVVLLPYTHSNETVKNFDELHRRATAGTNAMKEVNGTQYEIGLSHALMGYKADGTSMDWAFAEAGISLAYTVEMRPTRNKGSESRGVVGFLLNKNEILTAAKEAWAFVRTTALLLIGKN